MTSANAASVEPNRLGELKAGIFDVDGVLLGSPHERAWREALSGFANPHLFTTKIYLDHVAGKPRMVGARAALIAVGVPDADQKTATYAEHKQARLVALIAAKSFSAFPDALRFVHAMDHLGWPMAAASSSKNANDMLRLVPFDERRSLFDVFVVNVCGRDLPRGKPDPAIFLLAAAELRVRPEQCFVVEDAPAGVEAARAGGMTALGIARLDDVALLEAAGADLVVQSLDDIALETLGHGRLRRRSA
jgi:HAD superfamily hydrolase (TIGR01509 family)